MAFNYGGGATLNKTGIPALKDIYKKKTQSVNNQNNYIGSFNPNTNPIYNMYKTANETAGDQLAKRTTNSSLASLSAMSGGMPSSYAVGAATQAGAQAAQPFYQRPTDILPQLEQSYYSRGQDSLNRQDAINASYGISNPWGNVQITNPDVYKSSNDYMSKINEIKASPSTADDALLPQYYAARMTKMLEDPVKYASGLSPYKTQTGQAQDLQNQGQALNNKYYPQLQELNMQGQTLQNQGQQLQNKYYPSMTEAQLAQTKAQTSNIYADNARQNASSNKYERIGPLYSQMMQSGDPSAWLAKNANIMTGDELDALAGFVPKQSYEGLTYKDYATRGYDMMGAKNADGAVNKNQNQLDTYSWIKTLPLTGDEKARLASDLGINKDLVTNPWLGR